MFIVRTLGVLISSIGFGVAVGSGLATVGARCVGVEGRVVANVFEDAVQESGKGGDLAGSQESKGVGLDGGGPVGRVGVQGVEERFLDSRLSELLACEGLVIRCVCAYAFGSLVPLLYHEWVDA